MKAFSAALICLLFVLSARVFAETGRIDFETLPDGSVPTGGTVISNQYAASHGVSFRFANGKYPVIRVVGGTINGKPTAFWGWPDGTGPNMPAPGQDVGTYFLTDDASVGDPPPRLIISYSTPVAMASGYILDVDHMEAWMIYASNRVSGVIDSVLLTNNTPLTGDGIASPWAFNHANADIDAIVIAFRGDPDQAGIGLAFDNFSPAQTFPQPVPATLSCLRQGNSVDVTVNGTASGVYRIDDTSALNANWTPLTSIVLPPSSSFVLTNLPITNAAHFFRAVGVR